MALVNNDLAKQAALEMLLEEFKPPYRNVELSSRHYLIATPFRYPPLRHGSRFGSVTESSFFYASESEETCLIESVYYRFLFLHRKANTITNAIVTEHDIFGVDVFSDKASDLTVLNDEQLQKKLTDPNNYTFTQLMGRKCRKAGSELTRYYSARHQSGINVAIDNPNSIISDTPINRSPVSIEIRDNGSTAIIKREKAFPIEYSINEFLVDGYFPSVL